MKTRNKGLKECDTQTILPESTSNEIGTNFKGLKEKCTKRLKRCCQVKGCSAVICEEAVRVCFGLCKDHHQSFYLEKISDDDNCIDEKTYGSDNSSVGVKVANKAGETYQSRRRIKDLSVKTRNAKDHGVVYPDPEVFKKQYFPLLAKEINGLPFDIDSSDIDVCDGKRESLVRGIYITAADVGKMQKPESWLNDNLVHLLLHW